MPSKLFWYSGISEGKLYGNKRGPSDRYQTFVCVEIGLSRTDQEWRELLAMIRHQKFETLSAISDENSPDREKQRFAPLASSLQQLTLIRRLRAWWRHLSTERRNQSWALDPGEQYSSDINLRPLSGSFSYVIRVLSRL